MRDVKHNAHIFLFGHLVIYVTLIINWCSELVIIIVSGPAQIQDYSTKLFPKILNN